MPSHQVVIPVFDGIQPLDATGPHEVLMGATRLLEHLGSEEGDASAWRPTSTGGISPPRHPSTEGRSHAGRHHAVPHLTALDAIGPYEVLRTVPELDVVFVGEHRGEVRADTGILGLTVDRAFAEVRSPDIVVVPGRPGSRDLLDGGAHLDWLHAVHPGTRFTTSVCTGALVLAAAGLFDGLTAITYWGAMEQLEKLVPCR